MQSINEITLSGRVASLPEFSYTQSQKEKCIFSLAVDRDWCAEDGAHKESVDYFKIVGFDKYARLIRDHLVKGTPVVIKGKIQINSFDDLTGKKHFIYEIVTKNISVVIFKKGKIGVEFHLQELNI